MKTDNELIAYFIGGRPQNNAHWPGYYFFEKFQDANWWHTPDLAFDSSWNWLIPALQHAKDKIRAAGWGAPTNKEALTRLNAALNETHNLDIKATHFCLVKFIQWYNTQAESALSYSSVNKKL